MKKLINKSSIFTFMLGILISGISVFAYELVASDISYEPKDENFEVDNVASALNTLYDKADNVADQIDGTFSSSYYSGYTDKNVNTSLTLNKGNYYLFMIYSQGWNNVYEKTYNEDFTLNELFEWDAFSIDGAVCESIKLNSKLALSRNIVKDVAYNKLLISEIILKCSVKNEATFSVQRNGEANDEATNIFTINAIKID